MKVKNKEMLHIHRNGVYDDIWQQGNEFIIDEQATVTVEKGTLLICVQWDNYL